MVFFVWWMHWTLLLLSICGGGMRFPGGSDVKEFAYSWGDLGSIPGSGQFPWRITPFLPGESHGQRKLLGYRPWGFKKSNTTEHFHTFFFFNWIKGSKDIENVYRPSKILTSYVGGGGVQSLSCVWFFCDPMDCSWPGSSVHGVFQARILEWVCHFLLQEIFLTQGSNPCLLHWQADFPLALNCLQICGEKSICGSCSRAPRSECESRQ